MSSNEAGICPICDHEELNYGESESVSYGLRGYNDYSVYDYTCNKCGFVGEELYEMMFSEHRRHGGHPIKQSNIP